MEEEKEVFMITEETLQSKIYYIRGQKVMLDVDLAEIYGYETKESFYVLHLLKMRVQKSLVL